MRWRTGSSTSETAHANSSGPSAPLDVKHAENNLHEAASTTASLNTFASSSPLVGNEGSRAADSSVSASALISNSNSPSDSGSSSPRQALDPAADSVSSSAIDPDGDPPYKLSQHRKDGENISSNDEEDIDGLPALEAVNPEDGEEDLDDDAGDDHEVPWKPQATQSTCEFTHTITNYSQKRDSGCKKAEYSATTVDEFGNRWRLIVYVNGNGRASNHHLSLFLQV